MQSGQPWQSKSNPFGMSSAEWNTRVELAAAFRMIDHLGIRDLTHNHLSARVPDQPDCLLVKNENHVFGEVTASNMVKYRLDGTPMPAGSLAPTDVEMDSSIHVVHAGMLRLRPDLNAIFHVHTPSSIAVSAEHHGLLPISQHAMMFYNRIAYHDFGGFEFEIGMEHELNRDLGPYKVAILRNHGLLLASDSIGECFVQLHFLEYACQIQVRTSGPNLIMPSADICDAAARTMEGIGATAGGGKNWPATLRMCQRFYPDFCA